MDSDFHGWCAADRDRLLAAASHHYECHFLRPSHGVRHCCAYLGFEVALAKMGRTQLGAIDYERSLIYLRPAETQRLGEILAVQLGHIRLHELDQRAGVYTNRQQEEARTYASIFLLPRQRFRPVAAQAVQNLHAASVDWGVSPKLIRLRARQVLPPIEFDDRAVELVDLLRVGMNQRKEAQG